MRYDTFRGSVNVYWYRQIFDDWGTPLAGGFDQCAESALSDHFPGFLQSDHTRMFQASILLHNLWEEETRLTPSLQATWQVRV